ncbi:50S ribosomal protein L10 [Candidatus Bipolaricaulota bacterium]|nr:50S ribosomal protein L10 [Candidatus Bipolaricaulota bacterium]
MPTELKEKEVQKLQEKFESAVGIVLTDYRGLTANEMNSMRELFTKKGVEYKVVKNTLAAIAAEEAGFEGLSEQFEGPTGMAVGYDDPVLPFKISTDTADEYDHFTARGGVIEGDLVRPEEVDSISKLSSKDELLSQVAVGLKSPIRKLAYVLKAAVKDLAVVLKQLEEKKEE